MNRKQIIFSVLAVNAAMWLSSCQCFDAGEEVAPIGPIVTVAPAVKKHPPAAALNYMSTSLTAAAMNNFRPGQTVLCRFDFAACNPEFDHYPRRALETAGDLIIFRAAPTSVIVLYSRVVPGGMENVYKWEMRLDSGGKNLWKDLVEIELKPTGPVPVPEPTVIPPRPPIPEPTVIAPPRRTTKGTYVF